MYGIALMVKDEAKNIIKSLDSCPKSEYVFIFDTGSSDNTISMIQEWCTNNKKKLFLKEGTFVNFSESRNVMLDFIDETLVQQKINDIFLLLLDSNDELKNEDNLIQFIQEKKNDSGNQKIEVWQVQQHWYTNNNAADVYLNFRLQRICVNETNPKSLWRYKGSVHEYLIREPMAEVFANAPLTFSIYQDRMADSEKSMSRYDRDCELLLKDLEEKTYPSRTLYYLAQTYRCLGNLDKAIHYYERRVLEYSNEFLEETFNAAYQVGLLRLQMALLKNMKEEQPVDKNDQEIGEGIVWLLRSFSIQPRVEPLIELTKLYLQNNNFYTAYMFCKQACSLDFPKDAILFVNKQFYNYTRWHQMGHVAFYVGKYEEGLMACEKAIMMCPDEEVNKSNKQFYIEKLKET